MTNHANYVIPNPNPGAVTATMHAATLMIDRTLRRLTAMNVPEDPRLGQYSLRQALTRVFKVQPGNFSMGQVFEIRQNFQMLSQAARHATAVTVSAQHPMSGGSNELGHSAFAEIGTSNTPALYLCPKFFLESFADQTRTIVHELAHARLAVAHRGGQIVAFDACPDLPLRSFDDAIANAYAYDAFANCLGGR
jgi:hypothetical protein